MSNTRSAPPNATVFNVPNQLTALRLVLSVVLFVLIAWAQGDAAPQSADAAAQGRWIYRAATVVFLLAAGTDWLDGFWARRYGQVTMVGRIFDPFVDKVVVCGTFIFLVADPRSQVAAWMVVVIVARELLVTALRSHVELLGGDFSANLAGKVKMVVQCAAAATCLGALGYAPPDEAPPAMRLVLLVLLWAAVAVTVYSGAAYVVAAGRLLRRG